MAKIIEPRMKAPPATESGEVVLPTEVLEPPKSRRTGAADLAQVRQVVQKVRDLEADGRRTESLKEMARLFRTVLRTISEELDGVPGEALQLAREALTVMGAFAEDPLVSDR